MTWIGWEGYAVDEGRIWFVVNESIVLYCCAYSYARAATTWIRSGKNEGVGGSVLCSMFMENYHCKVGISGIYLHFILFHT